jgi:hypothetical protein
MASSVLIFGGTGFDTGVADPVDAGEVDIKFAP